MSHNTPIDDTYITPRMADFASSVAYKAPPGEVRPEVTGCKVFTHAFNMQYESFQQKTAVCVFCFKMLSLMLQVMSYKSSRIEACLSAQPVQPSGSADSDIVYSFDFGIESTALGSLKSRATTPLAQT